MPMNDADIVQMVQANVPPDLIIQAISKCEPHFLLDPGYSQYMIQVGVTYTTIKAMAAKQLGRPIPELTEPEAAPQVALQAPATTAQVDATTTHGDHHILKGLALAAVRLMCAESSMNAAAAFAASLYCQQNGYVVGTVASPTAQGLSVAISGQVPATQNRKAKKPKKSK